MEIHKGKAGRCFTGAEQNRSGLFKPASQKFEESQDRPVDDEESGFEWPPRHLDRDGQRSSLKQVESIVIKAKRLSKDSSDLLQIVE